AEFADPDGNSRNDIQPGLVNYSHVYALHAACWGSRVRWPQICTLHGGGQVRCRVSNKGRRVPTRGNFSSSYRAAKKAAFACPRVDAGHVDRADIYGGRGDTPILRPARRCQMGAAELLMTPSSARNFSYR